MSKISTRLFFILFLFFFHGFATAEEDTISITVTVVGADSNVGQMLLALFDSADNFLKQPIVSKARSVNMNGEAVFHLQGLRPGTYAIGVVYDEDSNGELNTNFLGMPSELVGFSNNAKNMFGPPSFDDAAIEFSNSQELEILLRKAKE